MPEQSVLTKIILLLQVEPVWIILLVVVGLLFVMSLIRKLLKIAFVLVLIMVGVYYYIDGEATAFWADQSPTWQEAVAEAGHEAVERGLELLEEVADGDLAQRAGELKQELQVEGRSVAERALKLLEEGDEDELVARARELKEELQTDGGVVAERILDLMEDIPKDEIVQRAKELRKDVEDALRRDDEIDNQQDSL